MYNHNLIEKKWQKYWKENKTFKVTYDPKKPKFYVLDMFPYPSGSGLHVGHPKGYTATDVISRYKRLNNFNVLHPIGWDAFGLPAEQYAIKTNNHPNDFTIKNINNFRNQLIKFGFDYDYEKEINTSDPKYYKWTQWIFTKLFEHGLAEIKDIDVNWCEELKTTLSNEEVKLDSNGHLVSDIGSFLVVKKPMRQWVLKITSYADKLLDGLNDLDWPESLKSLQKNWIGRMQGHEVEFAVHNSNDKIKIFTTRLDTIFGVTFLCINPKHDFVKKIINEDKNIKLFVEEYERKSNRNILIEQDKKGIFTNYYAIHPITKKMIPIWIGDYVLENVGQGVIMGVPSCDDRDYSFAEKYQIKMINVIDKDGNYINSDFINGVSQDEANLKIVDFFKKNKLLIKSTTSYKLKDWVFSRQRYWGEPFPILFDKNGKIICDENLPVLLPNTNDFKPSNDGKSPLQKISSFINVEINNQKYSRDSNTMPQWAGSCWYYLAYILKDNDNYIDLNSKKAYQLFKDWLPVDVYIGGQEHAVLHLLYARFWHRFLYDIKVVPTKEPFLKIINQGMILGENGEKMSKSKGNVINPDDIINSHGADALRLYELFMGPITATLPWKEEGINGVRKWLDRVYRYFTEVDKTIISKTNDKDLEFDYHNFIKNVTNNIENQQFNLAISDMMVFINALYKTKQVPQLYLESFLIVLSCFAPHLAEELWALLGNKNSVCLQTFPKHDEKILLKSNINIPFQINGKTKVILSIPIDASQEQLIKIVEANDKINILIKNKKIIRKIFVKNKIINYLIK